MVRVLVLRIASFLLKTWKNGGWRRQMLGIVCLLSNSSNGEINTLLSLSGFVCKFQKKKRDELSYILLKIQVLHTYYTSLLSPYQLLMLDVTPVTQLAIAYLSSQKVILPWSQTLLKPHKHKLTQEHVLPSQCKKSRHGSAWENLPGIAGQG